MTCHTPTTTHDKLLICLINLKKQERWKTIVYFFPLSVTQIHTGWLGSAAELPPGAGLHGRTDGHADRDGQHSRRFPAVDDHRRAPPLPHHAAADGHQVH